MAVTNVNSPFFQGSPCNLKWYNYFKNFSDHWDLECTATFCEPMTNNPPVGTSSVTGMFPTILATNVQCKNTTTYKFASGKYFTNYELPVATLIDMNATDEIDPRCVETKIPSATLTFKVDGITKDTPLDVIDALLALFDSTMVRIYRGFWHHTKAIRDENGNNNLDFYGDCEHDTVCLGNYKIIDRTFDHERQVIVMKCEHIFFNAFSNADTLKLIALESTKPATDTLYQRYPYPYKPVVDQMMTADPNYPNYKIETYKLGYSPLEMMRSTITCDIGTHKVPVYGYHFPTWLSNLNSYGLITADYSQGLWDGQFEPAGTRYWNTITTGEYQDVSTGSRYAYTTTVDDHQTLVSLYNTWIKESALVSVNSWNLMNCIHYIPRIPLRDIPEESVNDYYSDGYIHNFDGTWGVVQGVAPSENTFLDETKVDTWTRLNDGTNGTWFPAISDKVYKVLPSFIMSQSVQKEEISWTDVTWLKTYYMDFMSVGNSINKEDFTLPTHDTFSDYVDMHNWGSSWGPYPSDQNAGFQIATTQPLKDNTWYMPVGVGIAGYLMPQIDMFGTNNPARDLTGGVNFLNRGDSLVGYRVLWNQNLSVVRDKQPFVITLVTRDPSTFVYNALGEQISEDAVQNQNGIDLVHAYAFANRLSTRVLMRANAGDIRHRPMYLLSWTQVDDPSLRVGTVVWVPLQNEWIKVYITKQDRTFDGGARLTCTGWAYEKTGQKVYDPKVTDALMTYYVNNPDTDPKGEWIEFTWKNVGDYASTDNVMFTFECKPYGASAFTNIGTVSMLFGEEGATQSVMMNAPYIAERYGLNLADMASSKAEFRITGYFPPDSRSASDTCEIITKVWDNTAFSQLHVGYIRASNEHQPLIVGNPLQG